MIYGIKDVHLKSITNEITENMGTTKNPRLYIYGSRAKGTAREYSDIDLLFSASVYDEKSLNLIDFEKLDIPYKVDFVFEKNLFKAYNEDVHSHKIEIKL